MNDNSIPRQRLRLLPAVAFALLASACVGPHPPLPHGAPGWEGSWHGHASYPLGFFQADGDFSPAEEQVTYGVVDLDMQPPGSPISFVIQLLGSYTSDIPDEGPLSPFGNADYTAFSQFNLGVRKVWYEQRGFKPFIGAGMSFLDVSVEQDYSYYYYSDHEHDGDSDGDIAPWVGVGAYFASDYGYHFGLSAQYLFDAEVTLEGDRYDAGGLGVMFLFGVGW